jgi:outer membrane protein TolC
MKRSHITTTLITFLLLLSTTVSAQALSLRDCVNLALINKETLESVRFDVESARKARLGSYSAILPSFGISGGWNETRDAGSDFTIDPVTGEVVPAAGSKISTYTTWSGGFSLSQNIYDGGAWWNEIAKAKNNFHIARLGERLAKINIIADVHRRYFQVLKDIQLTEVASLNLDLAGEQVELTRMKYELGAVNKTDLLKAEVLLGQARVGVVNQESAVRNSMNELRNAMGLMESDTELVLQEVENVMPGTAGGESAGRGRPAGLPYH